MFLKICYFCLKCLKCRSINTITIFKLLLESCKNNIGVSSLIKERSDFNISSFYNFRKKLPTDLFKKLNTKIHQQYYKENYIYAIDGSKIHVKNSFKNIGYKSRTNDKPVQSLKQLLN